MPRGELLSNYQTLGARDGSGRGAEDEGRCFRLGAGGKAKYASEEAALAAAAGHGYDPASARAYECPYGHWHLTSRRRKA